MNEKDETGVLRHEDELFARVAAILDQARGNVVRSVNTNMVLAYWLIGREIVETIQEGRRAEYGKQVLVRLSGRLKASYGAVFSLRNLQYFRQFYLSYPGRGPIANPPGSQLETLAGSAAITNPVGSQSIRVSVSPDQAERFAPELTWSHYRALMRVDDARARAFYEKEGIECGWTKAQLERQIQSSQYERILAHRGEAGLVAPERERLQGEAVSAREILRSPLVLEFLDLPDSAVLHESSLEQAIIENLQSFMLELGKGFAFVARQKHVRFDDDDFYIDLVFYNFLLKCFVLVDLKIGKLTHRDVGQMDGYVRLFEERFKVEGDNPTVGLILCSDKRSGRQVFRPPRKRAALRSEISAVPADRSRARAGARERTKATRGEEWGGRMKPESTVVELPYRAWCRDETAWSFEQIDADLDVQSRDIMEMLREVHS